MTWHYRLMKHTEDDGEVWYGVHEYYELSSGNSWTEYPVTLAGADESEVRWTLNTILKDINSRPIVDY